MYLSNDKKSYVFTKYQKSFEKKYSFYGRVCKVRYISKGIGIILSLIQFATINDSQNRILYHCLYEFTKIKQTSL